MYYPIFQSIVNTLDQSLKRRNINVTKFKRWNEQKINATGLEIQIDLSQTTRFLDSLTIHFDWDKFREASLARSMKGMNKHPFLKTKNLILHSTEPTIDVEMTWHFKVDECQPAETNGEINHRVDQAAKWMEKASYDISTLLANDDIITRWHLEMDGDKDGRYLTTIDLNSYFQFTFAGLNSLSEVHRFTQKKLLYLLYRAKRIIQIVDTSVNVQAA